ncbi:MAG: DUF4143 domain-containing protein [Desulfobulbaceae bacterium]|nr:DUF4143 domain-containing protein [Desulfobulbaceae bacterium]
MYICFRVPPFVRDIARSLSKKSKYYLFDWLPVERKGPLLENIVAVHIQKACHFWTDLAYGVFDLCYLRTKDKEEVDFCVIRDGNPWMLVECKAQSTTLSRSLQKFAALLPETQAFQLTTRNIDRVVPGTEIRIMPMEKFLSMLL